MPISSARRQRDIGFEVRVTILGQVQRGDYPTAFDRLLATRFGITAVQCLLDGQTGIMTALDGTAMVAHELEDVIGK